MADQTQFSQFKIYMFMILMVVTGSINTIANKVQQNLVSLDKKYSHPWFITFCMFIGESTCLIWYSIYLYQNGKKQETDNLEQNLVKEIEKSPKKQEISIFLIAIPAVCDFCASTLMCLGLSMMATSVYQMFRGSVIIFTAFASILFLKNKLYRQNFLGMGLVISGLVLVALGAMFELNKGATTDPLGVVLVLIAQLFSASMFISEEKLMKVYNCHPLKLVGFEGMWGSLIYAILMIIFKFTPCPFDDKLKGSICVQNEKGEWLVEDIIFAFKQLGNNGLLLFFAILYTLSIAIFNFVGVTITKQVSSASRAVVDTIRTLVIWIVFLTLPFVPKSTKESFSYLQMCGFIVLLAGTLIYNEILVLPCYGFNMYTKVARKEKEDQEKAKNDQSLLTVQGNSKNVSQIKIENKKDKDDNDNDKYDEEFSTRDNLRKSFRDYETS